MNEEDTFIVTNNANMIPILLLEPLFDCKLRLRVNTIVLAYDLEDVILFVETVLEYTATRWVERVLNSRQYLDQSVGCELNCLCHVALMYVDIYSSVQMQSIAIIHRIAALLKDRLILGKCHFM